MVEWKCRSLAATRDGERTSQSEAVAKTRAVAVGDSATLHVSGSEERKM